MSGHRLQITIDLGNAEMLTGNNVVCAIDAAFMRCCFDDMDLTDVMDGRAIVIGDINGNVVGQMKCYRRRLK